MDSPEAPEAPEEPEGVEVAKAAGESVVGAEVGGRGVDRACLMISLSLEALYLAKGVVASDAMNGFKAARTRFVVSDIILREVELLHE